MNDELTLSPGGAQVGKGFEGCERKLPDGTFTTYLCPARKLTIGYGHTNDHGRQFKAGDVWTQADCDAAWNEDIFGAECHVKSLVKVELSQGQMDALTLFVHNCGWVALAHSTLLRKLNAGDYEGAAREFLKWTHIHQNGQLVVCPGLVRRRHAESLMFSGHTAPATGAMPQKVAPPQAPPGKVSKGHIIIGGSILAEITNWTSGQLDSLTNIQDKVQGLGFNFTFSGALHAITYNPILLFGVIALVGLAYAIGERAHAHKEEHA